MGDLLYLNPVHHLLQRAIADFRPSETEPGLHLAKAPIDVRTAAELEGLPAESISDGTIWGLPYHRMFNLDFEYTGSMMSSYVTAYTVTLPTRDRVYVVQHVDGEDIVAAAPASRACQATDTRFLCRLLDSNGDAFGTPLAGRAPGSVILSDRFTPAFWRARMRRLLNVSAEGWTDVMQIAACHLRDLIQREGAVLPESLLRLADLQDSELEAALSWRRAFELWLDAAWLDRPDRFWRSAG